MKRRYKAPRPVEFRQKCESGIVTDVGYALEFYWRNPADTRLEDDIQKSVADFWPIWFPGVIGLHVPNETEGSVQDREKKIAMGIWPGMADWLILHPSGGYPFALIELKRATKTLASPVGPKQIATLAAARAVGAFTATAYGIDSFEHAARFYLQPMTRTAYDVRHITTKEKTK